MKYNEKLEKWIGENEGYEYYLTSRFMGLFWNCDLIYLENNEIQVIYEKYVILHMFIQNRNINLLFCKVNRNGDSKTSIQNKLYHEYNGYFELLSSCFKITQYNMYALAKYVEGVKRKIDAGFVKYSKLLEENIKYESYGYLQIGINNVFSLEELKELIDAYNRLYSLFLYACENGIEEIKQENIEQVLYKSNMVLESIHIGSEGLLVSVGVELIVGIIKAFVKAVFELNESEATKKKQELLHIVEMEEDMATRQYVFQLINLLESYLDKKERGCNNGVMIYIEAEIDRIIRTIERLQGTQHIDIAV